MKSEPTGLTDEQINAEFIGYEDRYQFARRIEAIVRKAVEDVYVAALSESTTAWEQKVKQARKDERERCDRIAGEEVERHRCEMDDCCMEETVDAIRQRVRSGEGDDADR